MKLKVALIIIGVIFSSYLAFIYFYYQAPPLRVGSGSASVASAKSFTGNVAVLQNATFATQSILTVLRQNNRSFRYEIFDEQTSPLTFQIKSSPINNVYSIDRLDISKLKPGLDYFLKIKDDKDRLLDTRQFQSLDINKKQPRIAVASCARVGWLGHDFGPISIWDQLWIQQPDILLFLGDMIYPDSAVQALLKVVPTLEQIQNKYVEAWESLRQYHEYNLIPVFSVMDDHDYGFQGANLKNNRNRRDVMLELFRTFYPVPDRDQPEHSYEKGPGAAFKFSAFGFKYIFLDNKYFRTASGPVGAGGEIWGASQLNWMTKILNEDKSPTFIASGTLFTFPIEQEDAAQYESPGEFRKFAEAVRAGKSPVVLMSGDVHFSDVRSIPKDVFGYPTYEITASRIHSVSPFIIPPFFAGFVGPEMGQPIHTSEKNFVILDPVEAGQLENLKVRIFEKDQETPLSCQLFSN